MSVNNFVCNRPIQAGGRKPDEQISFLELQIPMSLQSRNGVTN